MNSQDTDRLGFAMLPLRSGQVEVLWDEVLPIQARELLEDFAGSIRCWVIRRAWVGA